MSLIYDFSFKSENGNQVCIIQKANSKGVRLIDEFELLADINFSVVNKTNESFKGIVSTMYAGYIAKYEQKVCFLGKLFALIKQCFCLSTEKQRITILYNKLINKKVETVEIHPPTTIKSQAILKEKVKEGKKSDKIQDQTSSTTVLLNEERETPEYKRIKEISDDMEKRFASYEKFRKESEVEIQKYSEELEKNQENLTESLNEIKKNNEEGLKESEELVKSLEALQSSPCCIL